MAQVYPQNWNSTNRTGNRGQSWWTRVLLAALELDRDFRPAELPIPSLSNTVDAVSLLWQEGLLDIVSLGVYRLTKKGRTEALWIKRGRKFKWNSRHGRDRIIEE